MFSTIIVAAIGAVVATATPVTEGRPSSEPTRDATAPQTAPAVSAKQRYCVVQDITGSLIPLRTCRTRADWLAQGFDPIKK